MLAIVCLIEIKKVNCAVLLSSHVKNKYNRSKIKEFIAC